MTNPEKEDNSPRLDQDDTTASEAGKPAQPKKKAKVAEEPGDQEAAILEYLGKQTDYIPTLAIAKEVIGEGATTKDVNPSLYKLLSRKKVEKKTEKNGTKPRWKIVE